MLCKVFTGTRFSKGNRRHNQRKFWNLTEMLKISKISWPAPPMKIKSATGKWEIAFFAVSQSNSTLSIWNFRKFFFVNSIAAGFYRWRKPFPHKLDCHFHADASLCHNQYPNKCSLVLSLPLPKSAPLDIFLCHRNFFRKICIRNSRKNIRESAKGFWWANRKGLKSAFFILLQLSSEIFSLSEPRSSPRKKSQIPKAKFESFSARFFSFSSQRKNSICFVAQFRQYPIPCRAY